MRRVLKFDTAAGTAVASTGTEGSVARYAFGLSELQPGRTIEYRCLVRATATVGTDTLQIRVRFGTSATVTANTAIATGTATDVANNDIVLVTGTIDCQTTTRMVHTVRMNLVPAATGVGTPEDFGVIFTSVADTAYYLDVTADWSTANANSAQSECWAVYVDEV